MRGRSVFLALAAALAAAPATLAGGANPADCTGISGVFNQDPNLAGELSSVRVASGLTQPLFVTGAPGDMDRLFIVEKGGLIKILKNGVVQAPPFLNIDPVVESVANERGLLGLAFHPDYQNNGYFFVYYTSVASGPVPAGALTVARYKRIDADTADSASGQVVIFVAHPISNHNAGMIAFSPVDGHLYIGTGDGGSACDPGGFPGNAQNINSLLGKMLRLDVDSLPYSTAGNPLDGGTPGMDEIWNIGHRNPYRWSFDRDTGNQYIGDVGQDTREEVDCSKNPGNQNFGWNAYEGALCDTCNEWVPACPITLTNYVPPIRDYSLAGAPCAVVGGYVYRGCRMAALHGTYFYSDACDDFIKTFKTDANCSISGTPDLDREADIEPGGAIAIGSIVSFGEDNQGELYILDYNGGEVFKIVPELKIMEVSGPGATPLTIGADGTFVWENLEAVSDVAVRFYRVYRADTSTPGVGPSPFVCIHRQLSFGAAWAGGDTEVPDSGQVFYYLIVGENLAGDLSTGGAASDGTLHVLDPAACPN